MMRPDTQQDLRSRGRGVTPCALLCVALAGLCAALTCAELARADTLIRAGRSRPIVHNGNDEPQVFDPVRWLLVCVGEPNGATTQWTCGPFVHTANNNLKVNSRMAIQLRRSVPRGNWSVAVAEDETDVQHGDSQAVVVVRSVRPGLSQIDMTVTFVNQDASVLAAGDYEVTVVGTMTAN